MPIYIALLRGINVGGKNKIKMDELKRLFESAGLARVQTYIQSGNVLFESPDGEKALSERLEGAIERSLGMKVNVVIRTADELKRVDEGSPFSDEEIREAKAAATGESEYIAFLPEAPPAAGIDKLASYANDQEKFRIDGREVYMLFRDSIRDSRLSANLHRLGVPATVRNRNTVGKLASMAEAMKD